MAKIAIKNEKINALGGIYFVLDKFVALLVDIIAHMNAWYQSENATSVFPLAGD